MRIVNQYTFKKKSSINGLVSLVIAGVLTTGILLVKAETTNDTKPNEKDTKPNTNITKVNEEATKPNTKTTKTNEEARELITVYANIYNIKPKLAIAISRLETGNWTSEAFTNKNNFGGLEVNGDLLSYETKEQGVRSYIDNLYENYIIKGLDTPDEIATKYCPANANKWAVEVKKIMREEENHE